MTPEQIADRESVWVRVAKEQPEFTRDHDAGNNYHAVREIVLGGSVTWAAANGYFQPFRGARVMDVGANAGVYSAYCGLREAQVVAYEPFPTVFAMLRNMIERTGLSSYVRAVNAAVWTYTGKIPYIGHKTPNEDVTCYNGGVPTDGVKWFPADYERADKVDCISFEEAIGDTVWDCVKMDIEGGEFEVLLATPEAALKKIRFMYVEFHDWASQEFYDRTIKKLRDVFTFKAFRAEGSDGRYEAAYLWKR